MEGQKVELQYSFEQITLPLKSQKHTEWGFLFLQSNRSLGMDVLLPNSKKSKGLSLFFDLHWNMKELPY